MKTDLDVLLVATLFGGIGFAFGFGLSPACAQAAEVLKSKDGVTTLFTTPCRNAVILERFTVAHAQQLKAGTLKLNGRTIEACWVVGKQFVFLIDEDGDLSRVPVGQFAP